MDQSCRLCLLLSCSTAMYPSDKGPRLYWSGAAKKKREKKRRLDNAVAGTSKIQSFFETSTAGGDKEFPREINVIEMAMRLPLHPR